jgi:hypothetical protein
LWVRTNTELCIGADWVLVASKHVGIPPAEGGAAGGSAEWSRQQPKSNLFAAPFLKEVVQRVTEVQRDANN